MERILVYTKEDVEYIKQKYIAKRYKGANYIDEPESYPAMMLIITSESWDGSDCVDCEYVCKCEFD